MKSEFEEKQFEGVLNAELFGSAGFLFPIGQMLEYHIGIDAALVTFNDRFWKRFGYLFPLDGVPIDPSFFSQFSAHIDSLPKFRFNLFLQHKRPDYCKGPRGKHRRHFGGPYYRFRITQHQQTALERLANHTKGYSIVSYASPAFHTINELVKNISARTLVSATNFVEAVALAGHTTYNYKEAGAVGLVNDKPKEISGEPITSRINTLRQTATRDESNVDFLKRTADSMESILQEMRIYERSYSRFLEPYLNSNYDPAFRSIVKIQSFNYLIGNDWHIGI